MSNAIFRPPMDWETVYAGNPDAFTFGEEASQIGRTALHYFRAFGGDPAQAVALDLGCGEGRDTVALAAAGFHVTARDAAASGLEKIEKLRARRNVPAGRIDAALCDIRAFPFPREAYDLALAANVLQFLAPQEAPPLIEKMKGAVKPGGLCAVGVFSPAMLAWGAEVADRFLATADELAAFFPAAQGWLLLDRTEYWSYRLQEETMVSFAYAVARKTDE